MKTEAAIFEEALAELPRDVNGNPPVRSLGEAKALAEEQFWGPIRDILDPRGRRHLLEYKRKESRTGYWSIWSWMEWQESHEHMRTVLAVPELSFNVSFQLRPLFKQLVMLSEEKQHMDLVCCSLIDFIRLELGAGANAEITEFSWPEVTQVLDENWTEDEDIFELINGPMEHEIPFDGSMFRSAQYFTDVESQFQDWSKFQGAFGVPTEQRALRENAASALKTLISGLDPFYDDHTVKVFLVFMKKLIPIFSRQRLRPADLQYK